jgi:hypothetical protein
MYRASITQGIVHYCEQHQCFWFMDVINSYQTASFRARNGFQVWKIVLNKTGNGCKAICEDGNDNVILTQRIPYTSHKETDTVFWYSNETIYLPSEH